MEHYVLSNSKNKYIAQGDLATVINELMKVIKDVGSIPKVSFNQNDNKTEFRFEGYYCDFTLFLYPVTIDID